MKKICLLIVVLTYGLCLYAQPVKIGFTEAKIRELLSSPTNQFIPTFGVSNHDGKTFISMVNEECMVVYYFDSNGISDECIAIPKNDVILTGWISFYRKNYIEEPKNFWSTYTSQGKIIIHYFASEGEYGVHFYKDK